MEEDDVKIAEEIGYEFRKIADLKPHSLQDYLFGDAPDRDLQRLAESIKLNGMEHYVEILPDGTIICGHQRVRAAKLLGLKEIEIMVRYDLAAAGSSAVERRLIEDNLNRRQLTHLDRVRCAVFLAGDLKSRDATRAACKKVSEQLNCSVKTAERLLQIAKVPKIIQLAYDAGHLPQVLAARVANLSVPEQHEIALEIENAGYTHAKSIVKKRFPKTPLLQPGPTDRYRSLMNALASLTNELQDRVSEIQFDRWIIESDLRVLGDGQRLLQKLYNRAEMQRAEHESAGHDVQDADDPVIANSDIRDGGHHE